MATPIDSVVNPTYDHHLKFKSPLPFHERIKMKITIPIALIVVSCIGLTAFATQDIFQAQTPDEVRDFDLERKSDQALITNLTEEQRRAELEFELAQKKLSELSDPLSIEFRMLTATARNAKIKLERLQSQLERVSIVERLTQSPDQTARRTTSAPHPVWRITQQRQVENQAEQQKLDEVLLKLKQAKTNEDRRALETELREALSNVYSGRLSVHETKVEKLQKKLKEMEKQLKTRREAMEEMVDLRTEFLLKNAETGNIFGDNATGIRPRFPATPSIPQAPRFEVNRSTPQTPRFEVNRTNQGLPQDVRISREKLAQTILQLEIERNELTQRFGASHQRIKAIDQRIDFWKNQSASQGLNTDGQQQVVTAIKFKLDGRSSGSLMVKGIDNDYSRTLKIEQPIKSWTCNCPSGKFFYAFMGENENSFQPKVFTVEEGNPQTIEVFDDEEVVPQPGTEQDRQKK